MIYLVTKQKLMTDKVNYKSFNLWRWHKCSGNLWVIIRIRRVCHRWYWLKKKKARLFLLWPLFIHFYEYVSYFVAMLYLFTRDRLGFHKHQGPGLSQQVRYIQCSVRGCHSILFFWMNVWINDSHRARDMSENNHFFVVT